MACATFYSVFGCKWRDKRLLDLAKKLQAKESILVDAFSKAKEFLNQLSPNSKVWIRGSSHCGMAILKGNIIPDLDIDWIIPVKELGNFGFEVTPEQHVDWVKFLYSNLLKRRLIPVTTDVSRSFTISYVVSGYKIDVDLFPKILDGDGKSVIASGVKIGQVFRQWNNNSKLEGLVSDINYKRYLDTGGPKNGPYPQCLVYAVLIVKYYKKVANLAIKSFHIKACADQLLENEGFEHFKPERFNSHVRDIMSAVGCLLCKRVSPEKDQRYTLL